LGVFERRTRPRIDEGLRGGVRDVGHDIDLHTWAGFAVKDGGWVWQPVYFFGFGVLFGFIAIRWVVRRLRPAPNVTAESL
jgi:hypothetical protein